jgi:hypothetical protein
VDESNLWWEKAEDVEQACPVKTAITAQLEKRLGSRLARRGRKRE